jgi:hypothetical protein
VRKRRDLCVWTIIFLGTLSLDATSEPPESKAVSVPRASLCITEGAIEELSGQTLSVNVSKMRAYMSALTPQLIEAHFTYLGPTEIDSPLGSGELRRQFGLKLRAQDACNLVYVMWRIEPESKLVVSVKSNPGQHTSAQCGNRGYRNIKPRHSAPVSALRSGDTHILRAEMDGAEMKVFADNALVWEGSVGQDVSGLDGPVGIRSDNARLRIGLRVGQPFPAQSGQAAGCRSGAEESE